MPRNEIGLEAEFTLESGGNVASEGAPFHVLFLGDWSGDAEKAELENRRPLEIDRDNFEDLLRKIRPSLTLDFDNGNALSLSFSEFDDFHPDNIYRRVSLFENLRDVRRKLKNYDTFNEAAREVRSWFSVDSVPQNVEKPQVNSVDADNLLDAILSDESFDASSVKPKRDDSALSDFISDIVKPHLVRTDLAEQAELVAAVDEVSSDLMRQILKHKKFLALEAAWRGLYFLIRKTDTDVDLKIFICDVTKDELADNLKSVNNLAESFYYQLVVGEPLKKGLREPYALACGNYGFSPNVNDIAALTRIAQISQAANTPFVSHIRPEVLGVSSFAASPDSDDWKLSENSSEFKLWNALRSLEESRFLGLATPRFIARPPYGRATEPTEAFAFEEFTESSRHDDYVWLNPAFACAYLLAKSFRQHGWTMAENLSREIDGLPVHLYQANGETRSQPCAEIPMSEAGLKIMIENGLIPLVSFKNSDKIRVGSFQSVSFAGERLRGRWS